MNLKEQIQELSEKKPEPTYFYEKSIKDAIVKNFLFLTKNFTTKKIIENLEKEYTKFLLKGKEYADAVQALSNLAKVDLSILKQKLKEIDMAQCEVFTAIYFLSSTPHFFSSFFVKFNSKSLTYFKKL